MWLQKEYWPATSCSQVFSATDWPTVGSDILQLLTLWVKAFALLHGVVNPFPNKPWILRVCSTCPLKNTGGNWEIACNEQFLLFPQCFLRYCRTFCHFHQNWNCRVQTLLVWRSLKFVVWERVNEPCSIKSEHLQTVSTRSTWTICEGWSGLKLFAAGQFSGCPKTSLFHDFVHC